MLEDERLSSACVDRLVGIYGCRALELVAGEVEFLDEDETVLAAEVLVASGSVRETLKRPVGNPPLKELMEGGEHPYGMQTFEKHIKQLVREGLVARDAARAALGRSRRRGLRGCG